MAQESTFEPWIGETICEALAEGHSLLSICEAMGIPYSTARQWEKDNPQYAADSARAREFGCHALAEQCLKIADDSERDMPVIGGFDEDDPEAPRGFNSEHVQRARLRIDTRMRLIGKWLPKVYGDKVAVGGAEDLPPLRTDNTVTLTAEDAYKRMIGRV